jgi:hypothetical protein
MSTPTNAPQIFAMVEEGTRRVIGDQLQKLLEEKHLYQSLDVPLSSSLALLEKKSNKDEFDNRILANGKRKFDGRWVFHHPATAAPQSVSLAVGISPQFIAMPLPFIKTYCTECEAVFPFNPVRVIDQLEPEPTTVSPLASRSGETVQVFAFTYLCQGCRLVPEVFLVRRVGSKLRLSGRAPIEHVAVAKYIPPKAKDYFSGAIVAHQSGQTLAGLFLLRTAIEQWIRSLGAAHEKADQAIDWYMSTLPTDFRSWAPSLRDVYSVLSDALHKADASVAIFDKAKTDIDRHFDARRVRDLKEPQAPA